MTPLLAPRPRSDRAFERMYQRHVGDVYRYALAVMRNPADAEDVTQTTFLNAYRAFAEKGDRPEKPQNWLIAIAHNVCRQRFRQSARRPSEVAFEDDIADTMVDDEAPSAEDIRRALGHLGFNQRAALVMRELEGRTYAEIAEILDVTTSAVETLIFRARRALREQLDGSLTCGEAEFAISRQLDGRLPRVERGNLRAHLRECRDCSSFARRQRAQRGALKSLALIPLPGSLGSFFGGGGAAVGTGVAVKAAAALTAGVVIGGAGYEGVRHTARPQPASSAPIVHRVVARAHEPAQIRPAVTILHARRAGRERPPVGKPTPSVSARRRRALGHRNRLVHAPSVVSSVSKHQAARVVHSRSTHPAHRVHPSHPVQSHRPATPPKSNGTPGGPTEHGPPAGKKH